MQSHSLNCVFMLFVFHVFIAVLFVHCSLVVTCLERSDPLALLCVMFSCVFVSPGPGVVFDCINS